MSTSNRGRILLSGLFFADRWKRIGTRDAMPAVQAASAGFKVYAATSRIT